MGSLVTPKAQSVEGWLPPSDDQTLALEAAAWLAQVGRATEVQRDRRFLSTFAIYMVKQFRTEEDRLRLTPNEDLAFRIAANHRLAHRLRELILDLELGLEVTMGIRTFLRIWMANRQQPSRRPLSRGVSEH